jgi:general secretion pathway protein G
MLKRILKAQRGFTLIELMIVVSIIGILAAIAAPNYQWGIIRARESVLREDLYIIRSAIDQFYADQGRYPANVTELAEKPNTVTPYLKKVPIDPFTKAADWAEVPAEPDPANPGQPAGIWDVKSSSPLIGSDNKPYNSDY